jgi:hypothetical protein
MEPTPSLETGDVFPLEDPPGVQLLCICEDCGKKYRVDTVKIKGRAASFTCRSCGHQIVVTRPPLAEGGGAGDWPRPSSLTALYRPDTEPAEPIAASPATTAGEGLQKQRRRMPGRLGLQARAFLVFLILPFVFMGAAGLLVQRFYDYRVFRLAQENQRLAAEAAEEQVVALSASLAARAKLYLQMHPDLPPEAFQHRSELAEIFRPPVGRSGFAFLYERPLGEGAWRVRIHADPAAADGFWEAWRTQLGAHFEGFWKVLTGVREGRLSQGYCYWRDRQGKFRERFMACTPIADTPYVVAAAAEMEEFNGLAAQLDQHLAEFKADAGKMLLGGLGGALLLVLAWGLHGGLKLCERAGLVSSAGSGDEGGKGP